MESFQPALHKALCRESLGWFADTPHSEQGALPASALTPAAGRVPCSPPPRCPSPSSAPCQSPPFHLSFFHLLHMEKWSPFHSMSPHTNVNPWSPQGTAIQKLLLQTSLLLLLLKDLSLLCSPSSTNPSTCSEGAVISDLYQAIKGEERLFVALQPRSTSCNWRQAARLGQCK